MHTSVGLGSKISIPRENLSPLIEEIKLAFQQWVDEEKPMYPLIPSNPLAGTPIEWTGYSEAVRCFFSMNKINPSVDPRFSKFFVNKKPTHPVSYVWKETSLVAIAGSVFSLIFDNM